jgi:hypothetical protein
MFTIWQKPVEQTLAQHSEYVLGPDVVLVQVPDGSARLLDMGGGFYALPATGAEMVQGVLERDMAATVQDLAQQYEIAADLVEADLSSLVHQLERQGLLAKSPTRRAARSWWQALVLVPCLRLVLCVPFRQLKASALLILAYLAFACFGWARTVSIWQRYIRRRAKNEPSVPNEATVRGLDEAVRRAAALVPLPVACKERALAVWTLVALAGVPATVVVGLELFPLGGHCWCEAGPWTLSDEADICRFFTPVWQS